MRDLGRRWHRSVVYQLSDLIANQLHGHATDIAMPLLVLCSVVANWTIAELRITLAVGIVSDMPSSETRK